MRCQNQNNTQKTAFAGGFFIFTSYCLYTDYNTCDNKNIKKSNTNK